MLLPGYNLEKPGKDTSFDFFKEHKAGKKEKIRPNMSKLRQRTENSETIDGSKY